MLWTDGEEQKGGIVFGKEGKIATLRSIEEGRRRI